MVLGITGGIAAYKAAYLASALTKAGARVTAVMTKGALEFITPLTLQSLTKEAVYVDVFDERDPARIAHIALADEADLVVVAPATADFLGRLAHGLANDMLTSLLLATRAPVVLAPAMNVHMWENPLVQRNVSLLREAGFQVAEPGVGALACGYTGAGRLMEPDEILEVLRRTVTPQALRGLSVLVSAGPTRERVDPVRYLSNDSTGTMGYALAQAAWRMGARVTLVSGPVERKPPLGVDAVFVQSAEDMRLAMKTSARGADLILMAAAVADYRPEIPALQKIKKSEASLRIDLVRTMDILAEVSANRVSGQFIAGFAAETERVADYAKAKLRDKGLDLVVANDVTEEGAGFGPGTNRVTLYFADGQEVPVPKMPKLDVALAVLREIVRVWSAAGAALPTPEIGGAP